MTAIRLPDLAYADQIENRASVEEPGDQNGPQRQATEPPAPPLPVEAHGIARKLLQLGTDDLRMHYSTSDIAFSRDGKFIAASEANGPHPTVWLFDTSTGKAIKRIEHAVQPTAWISSLEVSIDSKKLLWGEAGGYVAVWDLTADRLIFRDRLHRGTVNDVTFSYWGDMFATAGDDGIVNLRQTVDPAKSMDVFATGEQALVRVRTRISGANCVTFTRDDTRIIAGTAASGSISIWRLKDGALLRCIKHAHGGNGEPTFHSRLNHLAVSPDGSTFMSVGQRYVKRETISTPFAAENVSLSEIRFWDLYSGKELHHLHGPEDIGHGYAALSREGVRVAVADYSQLRIIDADTAAPLQKILLPGFSGSQPEFSPDGSVVAVATNNAIGLFDVQTGKRLHHDARTPEGGVTAAVWSPNGERVATSHVDDLTRVWDAKSGDLIWHQLLAPEIRLGDHNAIQFLTFTRDGSRVIVAGKRKRDDPVERLNGIVAIYSAADGQLIREIPFRAIDQAALSHDEKFLVAASLHGSSNSTHLHGIDLEKGEVLYVNPPIEQREASWHISTMQFRPDSMILETAMENGNVVLFDGTNGNEIRRFIADSRTSAQIQANPPRGPILRNSAFTADGHTLISSSDEHVIVWDVDAGTLRRQFRHQLVTGYCVIAISPDGKVCAISDLSRSGGSKGDIIRLYDINTGELLMTVEPEDNRACVLSFSPDGTKLFTGYHRGSATIWDVRR
ncbi:MAG: WD40 repeat domain-containing protein [Planctomycetaceae bacterium]